MHTADPVAIDVAAGLVFRRGKLLITQRYATAHLGGLWEFPGGKREAHESFQECLIRELNEELGIEVFVGELYESITHSYPKKTVRIEFFICEWLRNEPQARDCPAFEWVGREQLNSFEFPPADARLLHRLRRDVKLWKPGAGSL